MRRMGKVSRRRQRNMDKLTPALCERAGGTWTGRTGDRCVGARCEWCGANGTLHRAHLVGRGQQGKETMDNLILLCPRCHRLLDEGPGRDSLREKMTRLVKEKNEKEVGK